MATQTPNTDTNEPVVTPTIDVPADSAVTVPEGQETPTPEQIEAITGPATDAHQVSTDAKPVDSTVGDVGNQPDEKPMLNDVETAEDESGDKPESGEEVETQVAKPSIYTVQAADLNAYPELSQQGVQYNDEIEYESKWVNKYDTAEKNSFHREAWPRNVDATKNGISFKE